MSGVIWTKFYWSDWLSDPGLRRCSPGARGLWIDLLCIMAQHDPIGLLAVRGEGLSISDIARMTGVMETDVSTLLGELDRNGVFSRDGKDRIYSRRMTRDAKKSFTARKNGKTGGNPTLRKTTDNFALDKGGDKSGLKGGVNTHMPGAICQEPGGEDARACPAPRAFESWERALLAIDGVRGSGLGISSMGPMAELQLEGFDLSAEVLPVVRSDVESATRRNRLNRLSWATVARKIREARAEPAAARPRSASQTTPIPWDQRLEFARKNRTWDTRTWGGWPHQPGCLVPPELLRPDDGKGWTEWKATA